MYTDMTDEQPYVWIVITVESYGNDIGVGGWEKLLGAWSTADCLLNLNQSSQSMRKMPVYFRQCVRALKLRYY